jgi:hypothetical protein
VYVSIRTSLDLSKMGFIKRGFGEPLERVTTFLWGEGGFKVPSK